MIRVVVVGSPAVRARVRHALAGSGIEVAGEAESLAGVDDLDAEAFVVAPETPRGEADTGRRSVESLTPREIDVLELLAEGLPNKAIAGRLQITEHTVKYHVAAILAKLGAQTRTEAVARAARLGLILF